MIAEGDKLPQATLMRRLDDGTDEQVDLGALIAGRRAIVFGLPGAFTGTCTAAHLPSFMRTAQAFRDKGIGPIVCFAVNDTQVMRAWDKATGAGDAGVTLLADPQSKLTEALGMRFDAPAAGMIGRCLRFSALINDGVVEVLRVEKERGVCNLTAGETMLGLV